jgi:hypothetical protein
MMNKYRCDICGRYVSEEDVVIHISPDTEFSPEMVTEFCPKCWSLCAEGSEFANELHTQVEKGGE